jgi:hypothetical protein
VHTTEEVHQDMQDEVKRSMKYQYMSIEVERMSARMYA